MCLAKLHEHVHQDNPASGPEKLKTALYMRVSTSDQSVESQRHELRQFIENRDDLELVAEYEDTISGVTERRKELDRLMTAAHQRKIEVVVFFDLSRLTRKGISHANGLLDEFKKAKVKPVCFAFPTLDFTDESGMGEMLACMLAWLANQERQMLQRRIKAGIDKAKKNGTESGHPIGRPKVKAEKQSRAVALPKERLSYREIGKKLRMAHVSVRNYCQAAGEGTEWLANRSP